MQCESKQARNDRTVNFSYASEALSPRMVRSLSYGMFCLSSRDTVLARGRELQINLHLGIWNAALLTCCYALCGRNTCARGWGHAPWTTGLWPHILALKRGDSLWCRMLAVCTPPIPAFETQSFATLA